MERMSSEHNILTPEGGGERPVAPVVGLAAVAFSSSPAAMTPAEVPGGQASASGPGRL